MITGGTDPLSRQRTARLTRYLSLGGVRQHNTHEELVGQVRSPVPLPSGRILDAIIVPAARPAAHLDHAVTLAQAAGRLVVLCSRQARADEVSELLAARSFSQGVVIDMPSATVTVGSISPPHARMRSAAFPSRPPPGTAISAPSATSACFWPVWSAGIACSSWMTTSGISASPTCVARHPCWASSTTQSACESAISRITPWSVMPTGRPGNRKTYSSADSVLAIDCTAPIGFFPDIYNEDWLFFYNDTVERRLAWSGSMPPSFVMTLSTIRDGRPGKSSATCSRRVCMRCCITTETPRMPPVTTGLIS